MFVKILDSTKVEASTLLSGVKDIHKSAMDRTEAMEAYDHCLILPYDSQMGQQMKVWRLYITNTNGNSYYLLADIGSVFIMNEDGKTIDRF